MDKLLIEKWVAIPKRRIPEDSAMDIRIINNDYDILIAGTVKPDRAELIVTAVNACKAINPNEPLKVAESLPDLFAELTKLKASFYMDICRAYNAGKENMRNTDIVNYM